MSDDNEDCVNGQDSNSPYKEWIYEVFAAARDGVLGNLTSLLEDKSVAEVNDALNTFTEEEGQKTTPLIVASKNGHSIVVKELIDKYKVYKEQVGLLKLDNEIVEGATALWCAVAFNKMDTVKCLLELGADINTVCPLRAAVFEGNLDMVKFLVENGAMVNIPSRYYNNTCLMLAAVRNNNANIVNYLLENGANLHAKDQDGRTALHYATEQGNFDIVRNLLEAGAANVKDHGRLTPLMLACMNRNEIAAKFLIDRVDLSTVEEIDALELLGASFQDAPDCMENVYDYLYRAMEMRENAENAIHKVEMNVLEVYSSKVECQTLEELRHIEEDPVALNFEALLVKERILGEDNEFVQDSIVYVAGVLADNKKCPKALELICRAVTLKLRNHFRASGTLLYLYDILVEMVDANEPPCAFQMMQLIECAMNELTEENTRIAHAPTATEQTTCHNGLADAVQAFLQLLAVILKLERTTSVDDELYKLLKRFNQLDIKIKSKNMYSPLHIVCSERFELDACLFEEEVYVPHPGLLKVLFLNGAKPDHVDILGNTPLHFVFRNSQATHDKKHLRDVLEMFFQAGAKLKVKNNSGSTPLDLTSNTVVKYLKGEFRKSRYKTLFP